MATTTLPPLIAHKPELKLFQATTEDVQAITRVWYIAFSYLPFARKCFPDVPSVRKWWDDHSRNDIENKPSTKYLVVKDVSPEGKGKVVGYAKWWVPIGDERYKIEERFPPWPEEGDVDSLEWFFGNIGKGRKEIMGDKQYYFLDILGTLPEYRRLGVASMVVGWGVELADRDGLECFVGASDQGKHVYSKFGFLPGGTFEVDGYTVEFYNRPAKK